MMRLPALVLALLIAVFPAAAFALGLGNVEVSTTLNEPLQAEIPITGIKPGESDQIEVRLATDEQFQRAGIERPFHLTRLKFKVVPDGERKALIEVTSKDNITEPFLNFLIELNWPSGRMIREYTVLLDPPVYGAAISSARKQKIARTESVPETAGTSAPTPLPDSRQQAAAPPPPTPVTPPRAATPAPTPAPEPAPEVAAASTPEPAPTPAPAPQPVPEVSAMVAAPDLAGVDRYGPVIANESLWSIAKRVRPDEGISIQRMMFAILEANREAFFLDNINSLKKGAVLRIPDRGEIGPDDKALAMAEVRRHQALWDEYRSQIAGTPAITPEGTQAAAPGVNDTSAASDATAADETTGAAEDTSRLQLLAAGASPNAGAPGDQANLAQLQQELNMALEDADSKQLENQELSERLSETERIISDLNRMLELKDDEIASLQNQLSQDEAVSTAEPAPAVTTPETAATTPEPVVTMPEPAVTTPETAATTPEPAPAVATPEPAPAVTAEAQAQPTPAPPPKPKVVPPQPQPQQLSFVDELLNTAKGYVPSGVDTVLLAGGLGILLILGGGVALYRRRVAADVGAEPAAIDFEDDQGAIGDIEDDLFRDDTQPEDENKDKDKDNTMLVSEEAAQSDSADAVGMVDDADVDPLSELNIYMAYEHFDQAEDLVRRAIADNPDRQDYRLKLLEVFYAAKDLPSFQEAAKELRDVVGADSPHMATATGWWEDLAPGRDLFGGPQAQAAEDASSGTAVEGSDDEVFDVTSSAAGDTEESAVDFDLGFDTTGAGAAEKDSQGSGVDFDLDSVGSDEVVKTAAESSSDVEFDLSDLGGDTADEAAASSGDLDFESQKNGGAAAVNVDSGELDFDVSAGDGEAQTPDVGDSAIDMGLDFGAMADDADDAEKAESAPENSGLDFEFDGTQTDDAQGDFGGAGVDLELESFDEADTNSEADGDLTAMDERLDQDAGPESAPSPALASEDDDLGLDFDIGGQLDDGDVAAADGDLAIGMESEESPENSGLDFAIEGDTDADVSAASGGASVGNSDVDFEIGGDDGGEQKIGIDTVFDGVFNESDGEAEDPAEDAVGSDSESNDDPLGIAAGASEMPELDSDTEDAVDLTFLGDAVGSTTDDDPLADLEFGDENTDDGQSDEKHTEFMLREVPKPSTGDTDVASGGTSIGAGSGELDDIQTKLDLAEAYIEMGDSDGARGILGEVVSEGSETQQEQAKDLLQKIG